MGTAYPDYQRLHRASETKRAALEKANIALTSKVNQLKVALILAGMALCVTATLLVAR